METEISHDGSTLYFCSARMGIAWSYELWQASIEPVVDFNADENIDTDDLLILIDKWTSVGISR